MTYTRTSIIKTLSAMVITCAVAAFYAAPVAAQTATNLDCKDCVKSKHLKNGKVKGKDLKDETVTGSKIADDAVDGSEIADDAVGTSELHSSAKGVGVNGVMVVQAFEFVPAAQNQQGTATPVTIRGYLRHGAGYVRPQTDSFVAPGPVPVPLMTCFFAPVHLPDGVTITSMEAVLRDSNDDWDFSVFQLRRTDLEITSTANTTQMAAAPVSGINTGSVLRLIDNTVTDPLVEAGKYGYFIQACGFHSDHRIYGARIFYS